MRKIIIVAAILVLIVVGAAWLVFGRNPKTGHVLDEALAAGRDPGTFTAADEDYFHDMDGGIALTPDEVKGRNTWIVWTGGNDAMWDKLTVTSVGALDFLKIVSSGPGLKFSRDNRWEYLGLVNEPCFDKATEARSEALRPVARQAPSRLSAGSVRERAEISRREDRRARQEHSRRLLLRLRDRHRGIAAVSQSRLSTRPPPRSGTRCAITPIRLTTTSKDLVRPYRVGMSCGFCHVGPNPVKPPADPEQSEVGESQLQRRRAVFLDRPHLRIGTATTTSNFVFQLFHTSRPGHARYFVRLDRQHQQPADDERGLSARTAARAGASAGARRRSPAAG